MQANSLDRRTVPLLGERFGQLVVIDEPKTVGSRHRRVLCRCDCGKEKLIAATNLRTGNSTTCGCNRSAIRFRSVKGQVFAKLTVIDEPETTGKRRVTCQCECGRIVTRWLSNLKRGLTKSCGCTKRYSHQYGYVYYLFDPIDMQLRYIGQSVQDPHARLSNHVHGKNSRRTNCEEKREWIRNLKPYRPALWVAEKDIPASELDEREEKHIADAIDRGESLLNIQYARESVK